MDLHENWQWLVNEWLSQRAELKRLRTREAALLDIIRWYNPDDAVLDHEKGGDE